MDYLTINTHFVMITVDLSVKFYSKLEIILSFHYNNLNLQIVSAWILLSCIFGVR